VDIKIHAILSVGLYLWTSYIRGYSSIVRGKSSVVRGVVVHVWSCTAVVIRVVLRAGVVAPSGGVATP